MATGTFDPQAYIAAQARARGLDPQAVAAVGGMEGYSGRVGDGGHAFGPWQLNNAGGVITGQFQGQTPDQINKWAWSPTGINYALDRIQKVATGLHGQAAINAIVNQFERPANPGKEIAGALAAYSRGGSPSTYTPAPAVGGVPAGVSGPVMGPPTQLGQPTDKQSLLLSMVSKNDPVLTQLLQQKVAGTAAANLGTNGAIQAGGAVITPTDLKGVATGNSLVKTAMTQMGKAYQYGGPAVLGKNTDCSGLIQATLGAHGIAVGRTTYEQWKQGSPVSPKALQPGDSVFFHMGPNGPEHVGMFIGGGKFIEDPHTGSVIHIENLASYPGFAGARRYI